MTPLPNWLRPLQPIYGPFVDGWRAFYRSLRRALYRPAAPSRPVFLTGCHRSGTTITVRTLEKLWQIELYSDGDPRAFQPYWLRDLPALHQLVKASRVPVLLFKPNNEAFRLLELLDEFPGAQGLFIFRHFDDVVNSIAAPVARGVRDHIIEHFDTVLAASPSTETHSQVHALRPHAADEPSLWALFWLLQNSFYFDLALDKDPRVLLLQYEVLVSDPDLAFRRLTAFIGLPFKPWITRSIHPASVHKAAPPSIAAPIRAACETLHTRLFQALAHTSPNTQNAIRSPQPATRNTATRDD